jgi:ABC-type molybdate transport system substrate-binding protein
MNVAASLAGALIALSMASMANANETVLLHAAGSLRTALTEVAVAFEGATRLKVESKFGPSGLLRDRVAGGERAEVFASANMEHPRTLMQAGKSGPVTMFARNRLCALVRPGLAVTGENLLDRMLDEKIKLGTSTPKADPSGDYAWEVFRKAEALRPGAFAMLDRKALKLTGGPQSPQAPAGKSLYGMMVAEGRADIFLAYCTATREATREYPAQQMIALPDTLSVGADYGLTVVNGASESAQRFARFILAPEGQTILTRHGFAAPGR